ncbi:MAG: putative bifunctional diguanylate cyclase/phosphodiesterase, partial [Oceanobacter sp.]
SRIREEDTVSRIGGDEFTVLLNKVKQPADVIAVAEKILEAFRHPIRIRGQDITISMSIGITLSPNDSNDPNTLMKNADLAMYRAKDTGRNNYQFFSEALNDSIIQHLAWEKDLSIALNENQFALVYQPKIDIQTGVITGVEALVRWQHPDKGFVRPDMFIPVAEETGHILALGRWVIKQSCFEFSQLLRKGLMPATTRLAVNLSARQFADPDLEAIILGALAEQALAPENLELEITESTLMIDVEQAIATMNLLKGLGIRFAIDDFGTGYSSLSYIKRFPVQVLKVDKSFVMDIPEDENDMAITAAVIAMAHKLGISVVAEGIETRDHLDFLRENSCEQGQGYLISRPLTLDQLIHFLKESPHIQLIHQA